MLEVVEYQKHLLILQMLLQGLLQRLTRHLLDPERLGENRRKQGGISQWSQGHEDDPVCECLMRALSHFEEQAGLVDPARAGQGQQARVLEAHKRGDGRHFAFASDKRRKGRGEVAVGGLHRRAVGGGATCRRFKIGMILASELQGFRQLLHGVPVGAAPLPAFEQADGLGCESRPSCQLLLGKVGRVAVASE
jgi:hypothetical protein